MRRPSTSTDRIADEIPALIPMLRKPTGATVIYDEAPARLLDRMLDSNVSKHYKQPTCFSSAGEPAAPMPWLILRRSNHAHVPRPRCYLGVWGAPGY